MSAPSRPIVEADLHAFIDGQMDFERRAAFVQAMAADPELRAKVEAWRRQNEALTATFGPVLREPVPLRLMPTALGKDKSQGNVPVQGANDRVPGDLGSGGRPGAWLRVSAIAMVAFLFGGATVLFADWMAFGPSPAMPGRAVETGARPSPHPLALRAYEAHRTYATDLNHPAEVLANDEPHLLKWIQHRLAMAIRIPDLRQLGWALIGGRVVPGELGPAAFLIYGNGVERLGLYVARTNAHQTDGFSVFDNGAGLGTVASWVDEPVGYALTTSRDASWLERDGPSLYKSVETQARDNASAD